MRWLVSIIWFASASMVLAETMVATRNIRPGTVLIPSDIKPIADVVPGAVSSADLLIGMETKSTLYAGRPIMAAHVGQPATVERNQLIQIVFLNGTLKIQTEGRALGRGSPGDRIRVLNLSSKASLYGTIHEDGSVHVSF